MSTDKAYLGIWLVFAWIVVPFTAVTVSVILERTKNRIPPWLIDSAEALLRLDAEGALSSPIGGHAHRIIEEFLKVHKVNGRN